MARVWLRAAVAETIGTFALVFVGVLAVAVAGDAVGAVATGLTMAVMVAALGHVSGAHFNPAITLAMLLGRMIDAKGSAIYLAAQAVGGCVAALTAWATIDGGRDIVGLGTPALGAGIGDLGGVVLEAIATFFLVLVVCGAMVDRRAPISVYPFAIGLALTAGALAIGPLTGGALNPARGFGPALVSGHWDALAAWLVGPLVGGVLAWAVWEFVIGREAPSWYR